LKEFTSIPFSLKIPLQTKRMNLKIN